jgi:hypothetical protein
MTEQEIELTLATITRAIETTARLDREGPPGTSRERVKYDAMRLEANAAIGEGATRLVAQVLVDLHRLAHAADTISATLANRRMK